MLQITKTVKNVFAADPFNLDLSGLPVTSETVAEAVIVFEDDADLLDWMEIMLGVDADRAALLIGRKCEFDSVNYPETGNQITMFRVGYAA